jgi:general secretion pathway protein H
MARREAKAMTPTSATGSRSARAGLTLVELMIVLVILGLAGAAVVMTLPDSTPSLDREAEVFAARLVRAREEAILTNRTVEVSADAEGYAFRIRRPGERQPLEEPPFEPVQWAERARVQAEALFVFDPTGGADPADLALSRDDERALVSVDSAGEVSFHAG